MATLVASQRTLCFKCRPWTKLSNDCQLSADVTVKRQRMMETSIVKVCLVELIRDLDKANEENDKHYGLFVWPSALLLSRFIAHEAHWLCRDKVTLELGCGTGLPSILAGLCGATKVYLTDRPDAADIQRNAEANIHLNGIKRCAEFIPLMWGDMHVSSEILSIFETVEVILAADCFYRLEDFEKVLATVALICRCSASDSCKFYFTYQLRSINQTIAPLLSRWNLTATSIDTSNLQLDDDVKNVQDFDSIYLYAAQVLPMNVPPKTNRIYAWSSRNHLFRLSMGGFCSLLFPTITAFHSPLERTDHETLLAIHYDEDRM